MLLYISILNFSSQKQPCLNKINFKSILIWKYTFEINNISVKYLIEMKHKISSLLCNLITTENYPSERSCLTI